MKLLAFILTLILNVVTARFVIGQHDPGRNAMKELAKGDFEGAVRTVNAPSGKSNSPITNAERNFVLTMISLKQDDHKMASRFAFEAAKLGIPAARFQAMPDQLLNGLNESKEFANWLKNNRSPLLHGPMLGAVTEKSAKIWLRTDKESRVQLTARSGGQEITATAKTNAESDFTCTVDLTGLRPDTKYNYKVAVDDVNVAMLYEFQTYPEKGSRINFKMVFGGGAGYTRDRERMWSTLGEHDLSAVLLLGDNVYIDDPTHLATHRYCYHRRQSEPRFKTLFSSIPVYAIYDDHDFGLNDCIPGPEIETPAWKREVWEVFRQNWPNPSFGGDDEQPGCWYDFHIGDVHFILVDGRFYRDRDGGSMLGRVQKSWLKERLASSTGTFKVIATPVPVTPGVKPGSKDTWDGFPDEREEILNFIEQKKIDGVVFMAADRHRSDFRRTLRQSGYPIYELMSSALTNVHTHNLVKNAKGSEFIMGYNEKCSFGLVEFDTTISDPSMSYQIINIDNEVIDSRVVRLSEISHHR